MLLTPLPTIDVSRLTRRDLTQLVALLATAAAGRPLAGQSRAEANRLMLRAVVPTVTPAQRRPAPPRPVAPAAPVAPSREPS